MAIEKRPKNVDRIEETRHFVFVGFRNDTYHFVLKQNPTFCFTSVAIMTAITRAERARRLERRMDDIVK